jgi:integrase/recombinase XerD
MGSLQDQMVRELELRDLSPKTIATYLSQVRGFVKKFGKSPLDLNEEHIKEYLYWIQAVKKRSWSNVNLGFNALKFLYVKVLKREWTVERPPRPKIPRRLPEILSRKEVQRLIDALPNTKHRLVLMTTYSAGLRLNETAHLRLSDIDSDRMLIRVDQGKGRKDRYTLLSKRLLEELRIYWKQYRPAYWLFPGQKKGRPYSGRSIEKVFENAKKKRTLKSMSPSTPYVTALPPIF